MRIKRQIQCGDRYMKIAPIAPMVWVVERLMDVPRLPNHVRLMREDAPLDTMTVSVDALFDPRFYRPLASER